jgi:hypothetical protein
MTGEDDPARVQPPPAPRLYPATGHHLPHWWVVVTDDDEGSDGQEATRDDRSR